MVMSTRSKERNLNSVNENFMGFSFASLFFPSFLARPTASSVSHADNSDTIMHVCENWKGEHFEKLPDEELKTLSLIKF